MTHSTRTSQQLIAALTSTPSLRQACIALGYQPDGSTALATYLRSRGIRVVQRAPVLVIEVRQ